MNDKHVISKEYWIQKPKVVFPYPGTIPIKLDIYFKVPCLWSNRNKIIALWFSGGKVQS